MTSKIDEQIAKLQRKKAMAEALDKARASTRKQSAALTAKDLVAARAAAMEVVNVIDAMTVEQVPT